MGLVFEAEDTDLLRPVALKVIRPELAGTPLAAQRFTLEARAMAALKHDHIVTIYQVGQQRGVPFLAMEYLQGMSLDRWLERGHNPSLDLVLRLGREIAAGLAAAHRRGLIHRDIKPANIWLEAPTAGSRSSTSGWPEPRATMCRSPILGRPWGRRLTWPRSRHAAKEGRGVRPVQPRVRVVPALYPSIAVPGEDCDGRAGVASDGHTLSSRDLNPAVPPALGELVMRLLAKKPEDRPTSAEAVVEAIRSGRARVAGPAPDGRALGIRSVDGKDRPRGSGPSQQPRSGEPGAHRGGTSRRPSNLADRRGGAGNRHGCGRRGLRPGTDPQENARARRRSADRGNGPRRGSKPGRHNTAHP